ncbi:MAG: hypothetical protein P1V20_24350 [Verrucomicrobiales bacterium]|nr:hypothetical protein [Verrucomicrobiales bacterium]
MRNLRRIFVISCLLAVTGLIWAGIYARKQGFTGSWRQAVEKELAEQGYYIDVGKLTLGAFRGLVAEDVLFYRDKAKKIQFAEINDIYLDVDLGRVLQKEITINTLDFQEGRVTIPLGVGSSNTLAVSELSGRIALTESFVEVVRLEAKVAGFDVAVKGSFLRQQGEQEKPADKKEEETLEEKVTAFRSLKKFIDTLSTFEFPEGAPTVKIDFRGDLSELSETTARAVLHAGRFRRKGDDYEVHSFDLQADMDGRTNQIKISQFEFEDHHGRFVGDGIWHRQTNDFDFELSSDANLVRLLKVFFPDKKWGEVVIFHPPKLAAEGTIDMDLFSDDSPDFLFPGQIIGEFSTDGFGSAGEIFKSSKGDFSVKENSFYVRNVRVDHRTGVAFLNCKYEPGKGRESLQFQSAVKMDPRAFERFFKDADTRNFLRKWKFSAESGVDLAASGQCSNLEFDDLQARGEIYLRDFELNDVSFRKLGADFEIDGNERWYRNVQLMRDDGQIEAALAYTDTQKRIWEIKGGRSTVGLVEGFGAFSPVLKDRLGKYKFSDPPVVEIQGVIDGRNAEQRGNSQSLNNLEVVFSATGVLRSKLLGKEVSLDSPEGTIFLKGTLAELKSFRAGFCGGTFELDYESREFLQEDTPFDASIQAREIGLRSLGRIYGFESDALGHLNGDFQFSGTGMASGLITGSGEVSVADRDVFHLPVLKELGEILETTEESDSGGTSSASFEFDRGIIRSDGLHLLPETVNLRGNGVIRLLDQSLEVELSPTDENSRKVYRCTGSLKEPRWEEIQGRRSTVLSTR